MRRSFPTPAAFIAGGLFVVYLAVGWAWVSRTTALTDTNNLLFQADTMRVILNETSLSHIHSRTVLHPLHVGLTVPLGYPLAQLTGAPAFVAVLITAAFAAGCLWVFEALLRRATRLAALDRALFVAVVGLAAGQFTFASVPETHVLSGFFLVLAAFVLAPHARAAEPEATGAPSTWIRWFVVTGMVPLLLAAGALVTNVMLAPIAALVRLTQLSPFRRIVSACVLSGAMVALLGALHVAQRAAFYNPDPGDRTSAAAVAPVAVASSSPPAAPAASAPPASGGWLAKRFSQELAYVWWEPLRPLEVGLATVVFNFFTPRFDEYRLLASTGFTSSLPATRIDYWKFDFRLPGAIGAIVWTALVLFVFGAIVKARALRKFALEPLTVFASTWLALYFVIFNLYHVYPTDELHDSSASNDILLFAPNLVPAFVLLLALAWDRGPLASQPKAVRVFRIALGASVFLLAVNTGLHTSSLISLYASAR